MGGGVEGGRLALRGHALRTTDRLAQQGFAGGGLAGRGACAYAPFSWPGRWLRVAGGAVRTILGRLVSAGRRGRPGTAHRQPVLAVDAHAATSARDPLDGGCRRPVFAAGF